MCEDIYAWLLIHDGLREVYGLGEMKGLWIGEDRGLQAINYKTLDPGVKHRDDGICVGSGIEHRDGGIWVGSGIEHRDGAGGDGMVVKNKKDKAGLYAPALSNAAFISCRF